MHEPNRLFAAYAETRLTLADGTALNGPDAVDRLPVAEPAFVITASNPYSHRIGDEENRAANTQLARRLKATGARPLPAVGSSPAGDWSEESWLTNLADVAAAVALGREFGQNAIFQLTADHVLVIDCRSGRAVRKVTRRGASSRRGRSPRMVRSGAANQ